MKETKSQVLIFPTLIILSGFSIIALAAPMVDIKLEHYLVSGITANEIRNDLNAKTPVLWQGKKYDAYTNWDVNWNFWWYKDNGLCKITKVETVVHIKQTLPKLRILDAMPASLIIKWKSYKQALLNHEKGHRELGIKAAGEIESAIQNMGARQTCDQLEVDANSLANSIIWKYSEIDDDYDYKTNHGARNGAVFP